MRQRNTLHTSNNDMRGHITLHIKTEEMIAKQTSRAVHIYSRDNENELYDGFKIFEERPDKETDGVPGEPVD